MKFWMILFTMFVSTVAMAATELNTPNEVAAAFAKGRPMVIMFYTTWCGACKATKPEYFKAEKKLAGQVDFYLMNVDKIALGGPDPKDRAKGAHLVNAIPSFSAGNTESEIRSGDNFREGGGKEKDLLGFIRSATGAQ